MLDKDKVMVEYIMSCPKIKGKNLFFNYAEGEDETNHFITEASDIAMQKPFIDGSVMKKYSFHIMAYKSLGYIAVQPSKVESNENIEELQDVQEIIDWISEQREAMNFPNFGSECSIDDMYCTTDKPVLQGTYDNAVGTPIARYSITIVVEYLDKSKKLWR
jgi:hypothetical protein